MATKLLSRRQIWSQSWPLIFANAAIPLVGVIDTAVIGISGNATDLAGVALGGAIFAIFYWGTYALRQSTTALVSQAIGRSDRRQSQLVLMRSGLLGLAFGAGVLLFHQPITDFSFGVLQGSIGAEATGREYVKWRFAGIPAAIALFAITGWMIGAGLPRMAMMVQLLLAFINTVLDIWFVIGLGWGPMGVALGTSIAEWVALFLGLVLVLQYIHKTTGFSSVLYKWSYVFHFAEFKQLLTVNRDLFIRSGCMIVGFTWFINSGAKQGDAILAGNQILLQFITVWAFVLDAFAYTAEAHTGRATGKKSRIDLLRAVRFTSEYAVATAIACSLLTLLAGPFLLSAIISDQQALQAALLYLPWCALVPIIGVAAWQLDGIFVGATRSAAMRNSAIISVFIYLAVDYFLTSSYGNSGVWAAFLIYYLARGLTLIIAWPALLRSIQTG
ncbi:MAG: MATE family efflux transporter [Robiginitomaculum sp.]|nr:MATE family efflux transporter [Robiginitomaculum sp.]